MQNHVVMGIVNSLAWICLAVLTSPHPLCADETDPFSAEAADEKSPWTGPTDVIGTLPEKNSAIVYSSYPGKCIAFGIQPIQVVNCETGEIVGEVPVKLNYGSTTAALSANGDYFAHAESDATGEKSIVVYDVKNGKVAFKRSDKKDGLRQVKYLRFTPHGHLLSIVQTTGDDEVRITSVPAGAKLKEFKVKSVGDERTKIALSPDGRHLALSYWETLEVWSLVQGKPVARMAAPPDKPYSNPLNFVSGLAFSPDGTELAALISAGATHRFAVWSANGKIVDDFSLGTSVVGTHLQGDPVQWSPDAKCWLLIGTRLVDRELKAVAWKMERTGFLTVPGKWIDDKHVAVGVTNGSTEDIKVIDVPRDNIRLAVGAATGKGPRGVTNSEDAILKPGQKVSISVNIGSIQYASKGEVEKTFFEAAKARLEEGGLVVADGQPTVLSLAYSEQAGQELRVVEGGLGILGKETGQRVQETVGSLAAKLTANNGAKVLWEETVKRGNPYHVNAETINDEVVRKSMFGQMQFLVQTMALPYYVSSDGSVPTLPLVTSLD